MTDRIAEAKEMASRYRQFVKGAVKIMDETTIDDVLSTLERTVGMEPEVPPHPAEHDVADVAPSWEENGTAVADVADVAPSSGDIGELAEILDEIDALLNRYVAFPTTEARWAVAAWVVHCHALDAFESTPRLAVLSAEKGSGKTRVLEVIEGLVPGPLHTVNVSAAALFRKVSEGPCTLLLDEADTYLSPKNAQQHEDLRGLVNAGHRRGAVAYRCVVEKGVQVQEFPAFAPVALAGIGDLPDTILDRSVVVGMKRRAPHEVVEPFRLRRADLECKPLHARLASWGDRNIDRLADIEPEMPEGIVDRPADVWEPLIVLGDDAGEEWSARLRSAALRLNGERGDRDLSLGVRLLGECRLVFSDEDRLTTDELLRRLIAVDESPWGDLRGKELDPRGLAWRLRPYGVRSGDHRFGDVVKKGYRREDFHDAWQRYLPPLVLPLGEGNKGNSRDDLVRDDGGNDDE